MLTTFREIVRITRASGIMRRYSVVNGFDGALTMLGLAMGFRMSGAVDVEIATTACVGAAIALGVSGVSSAYISEAAERSKDLRELEHAMMTDLGDSAHGVAARFVPVIVALVNGLSPLLISLIVIAPLWLATLGIQGPWSPLEAALLVAFVVIFLLGVFLGRLSGQFWLWTGLRAMLTGAVAVGLILALGV